MWDGRTWLPPHRLRHVHGQVLGIVRPISTEQGTNDLIGRHTPCNSGVELHRANRSAICREKGKVGSAHLRQQLGSDHVRRDISQGQLRDLARRYASVSTIDRCEHGSQLLIVDW